MNKENFMILSILLLLVLLPIINADMIEPGYSPIDITNKITNINDFPDYIFVSGPSLNNSGPGIEMCSLQLVGKDGTISTDYYKFCSISVFAIEKNKWDSEKAKGFMEGAETDSGTYWEYIKFMNSSWAKEVIMNVEVYKAAPDFGIIAGETNYYTVNLNQVKTEPEGKERKFNYISLVGYPLISLAALIIIITILMRRKK